MYYGWEAIEHMNVCQGRECCLFHLAKGTIEECKAASVDCDNPGKLVSGCHCWISYYHAGYFLIKVYFCEAECDL